MEFITEFFTSGDIWPIVIKVLITALLSAGVGLFCALIGKLIAKMKNSKIRQYATICVEAAEQKFPNEGRKMGPEKMAYVMDQLAIKFPKIKENTYLYNIAEAAVLELNNDIKKAHAIKEFEEKYGEKPLAVLEEESYSEIIEEKEIDEKSTNFKEEIPVTTESQSEKISTPLKKDVSGKIKSF